MAKRKHVKGATSNRIHRNLRTKYTPEFIIKFGEDLLKWAEKDDAYFLDEFLGQHKPFVQRQRLADFSVESPEFDTMFIIAKTKMLARIYKHTAQKKLDGAFIARILPLFDPEYRAWRREEIQIEDKTKASKFNLYIHPDRLRSNTEVHDGK